MKQSASLQAYHNPIVLPDITISTGSTDFHPIKKMRLVQFDGTAWRSIGHVFEDAFIGGTGQANP
jgi:branched-chain amino acid transport system substrate-binding protein